MTQSTKTLQERLKAAVGQLAPLLLSVALSVVVGSLLMLWYGQNPIYIYRQLFKSAFGTETGLFTTLQRATPLIFTAIASTVAFRTGVFNIGIESQVIVGGLAGTWVGYAFRLPTIVHLPLCFLAAFLAGALWAVFPALMRQKLGISEIITTIMTNYIGTSLVSYLLIYVMRVSANLAETPYVNPTARLLQFSEIVPRLGVGSRAHIGIFLAFGLAVLMHWVFKRTKIGYEWRMVGLSFPFSEFVGINLDWTFIGGFLVSGGIAGLGGLVEALGVWRRFKSGIGLNFGFKGNLASLLGNQTIFGSTLAGLFYGSMEAGALGLEWTVGIPRQLIDILVGLIIFFMAAPGLWDFVKRIRWISAVGTEQRTTKDQEV